MRRLGARTAVAILGTGYATLHYWYRTGILPLPTGAKWGRGAKWHFEVDDLVRAATVRRLREQGLSLQMIRRAITELGERYGHGDALLSDARLIVSGGQLYWADDDASLLHVLRGQWASRPFVLELAPIVAEVEAKVEALRTA